MLDEKTNIILKELDDGSQEYIGLWDPIEIAIKYNEPMPDIEDEELEMDTLRFYLVGSRLYYGNSEIV